MRHRFKSLLIVVFAAGLQVAGVLSVLPGPVARAAVGDITVAGGFVGDGGPATSTSLASPKGVAGDASGNLLIADTFNYRVRRVAAGTGIITTVADIGTAASFHYPSVVAVDEAGNVFIADTYNHRIGRVAAATPTPAPNQPPQPSPAEVFAPLGNNLVRVWGFDAATQKFRLYDPAAPILSDLNYLGHGQGYWINVRQAQTVTLGSTTYNLSAGWNLKGWLG